MKISGMDVADAIEASARGSEAQRKSKRTEIAKFLTERIDEIVGRKDWRPAQKESRVSEIRGHLEALEAAHEESAGRDASSLALRGGGSALQAAAEVKAIQRGGPSLHIPEDVARQLFESVRTRSSKRVELKAAADLTGLLPPQLAPGVLGPVHEGRILDHLRTQGTTAPSVEYVQVTGFTGTPAMVAPGAAKPELTPNITNLVCTVRKLAAWSSATTEALADFASFNSWLSGELVRQIIDVENAQLLFGSGSGQNILGMLNVSGILTRAVATSPAEPQTDTLSDAIADLRTGSAKAVADLLVLHPLDWAKIRKLKDSQGRYLIEPDPRADQANSVWGIPVVQTTAMTAGTGLLADTAQLGQVWVREGVSIQSDPYSASTNNIVKFIGEERFGLAVERPAAVVKLTGL